MTQQYDHRKPPQWDKTTEEQGNRYLQWNSLVEETAINDLTVTLSPTSPPSSESPWQWALHNK